MGIELEQFHEVFFAEASEALDAMESSLLKMGPGAADSETINTVFRAAHSIKGGAGMFGFNDIAGFTHTLETLLDELRAGRMLVTASLCDSLLQSVDQIRSMMSALQKQQVFDISAAEVLRSGFERLIAEQKVGQKAGSTGVAAAAPAAAARTVTAAAILERETLWDSSRFRPQPAHAPPACS